jgi:dTDP-4-amino-4,6-dideoxygalactose transaminase
MIHLLRQLPPDWRVSMPVARYSVESRLPPHDTMCEVSTGRGALAHLLERLALTAIHAVLLPSYIAEGVIRPLQQRGVRIVFYRLHANLQPDENDIVRLLREDPSPRLLILVHPLGYEAGAAHARAAAADRDCLVLDDCAQALLTDDLAGHPIGGQGDFALFSLNKFLPVPDGAILTSRRPAVDVSLGLSAPAPMARSAVDAYLAHLALNAQLLAADDDAEATRLVKATGDAYDCYYAEINDTLRAAAASVESREIRRLWDPVAAAGRRRQNAERLHASLGQGPLRPVQSGLPTGVVPMGLSVLAPAGRRDDLVARAWSRGLLLSTLVGRWNFVPPGQEDRFRNELDYMDRHVLVPVSEFLDDAAMDQVIDTMNVIGRELSRS